MYERDYAFTKEVEGTLEEAEARVREALATEGFGVLTTIDVQATFKAKLGIDRAPYRILGACNPALANEALQAELPIGLLLPCNVVVYEGEEGKTWVQAIRPQAMFAAVDRPEVQPLADEVAARLERVMAAL